MRCEWPCHVIRVTYIHTVRAYDCTSNAAQHARSCTTGSGEPYRWHDPRSLAAVRAIVAHAPAARGATLHGRAVTAGVVQQDGEGWFE